MVAFAWLGGVAFVAALAYLAYFYAVVLAVPAPAGIGIARAMVIDVVLFVAFATHHSLLARARAKRWVTRIVPARAERTLYVWVASVLTIAMCALWQPLPGWYYETDGWSRRSCGRCRGPDCCSWWRRRGRSTRATSPAFARSQSARTAPRSKPSARFAYLRHLIYLILAIPWEEKSLVAVHGDRYRDYQRMVRWRILPGVW